MKLTTKQLTLCAVLTALALAFSYLENYYPLSLAIPIPGIKLGLAKKLAKAMGASYFQVDKISEDQLLHIWRTAANR